MAGSWTADRFPQFEAAIRRLTEQHRELQDEPLHLAISYQPVLRDQQDIFLFEVIGAAENSTNAERDFFETSFSASPGFPLAANEQLHLVLTDLQELQTALHEGWPLAIELVNAMRAEKYKLLFTDETGRRAEELLREEVRRQEVASG